MVKEGLLLRYNYRYRKTARHLAIGSRFSRYKTLKQHPHVSKKKTTNLRGPIHYRSCGSIYIYIKHITVMVDFKSTYSDTKGMVHFCDENEDVVQSYGMEQVIEYAKTNYLRQWVTEFEESGKEFNPMKNKCQETYFGKFEQYVLDEGLDDIAKWREVTEQFYNSLNKSEYKSQNLPQQTKAQTV